MRELSAPKQSYLHPPLWSGHLALGKLIIRMSIKISEVAENPVLPYVCNRLESLRREQGIARKDLASGLKISEATLVAIEEGRYMPSLELALRISTWFDLPVENIFFG